MQSQSKGKSPKTVLSRRGQKKKKKKKNNKKNNNNQEVVLHSQFNGCSSFSFFISLQFLFYTPWFSCKKKKKKVYKRPKKK